MHMPYFPTCFVVIFPQNQIKILKGGKTVSGGRYRIHMCDCVGNIHAGGGSVGCIGWL